MATLESYRTEAPVARVKYIYGDAEPRPFLFHEGAGNAFYITLDALNRFQSSRAIGGNPYVIPALGLWFQATESYVSTIYKISELDASGSRKGASLVAGPRSRDAGKPHEKYRAVEEYFGAPIPLPKAPISALREFGTLRNGGSAPGLVDS